jgi:DNA-directed RNA polymerase specialized sigma24 family protein
MVLDMKMRYRQDLSIKQMAVLTGQSENTVSVQAHRGLQKLKILYREANPI